MRDSADTKGCEDHVLGYKRISEKSRGLEFQQNTGEKDQGWITHQSVEKRVAQVNEKHGSASSGLETGNVSGKQLVKSSEVVPNLVPPLDVTTLAPTLDVPNLATTLDVKTLASTLEPVQSLVTTLVDVQGLDRNKDKSVAVGHRASVSAHLDSKGSELSGFQAHKKVQSSAPSAQLCESSKKEKPPSCKSHSHVVHDVHEFSRAQGVPRGEAPRASAPWLDKVSDEVTCGGAGRRRSHASSAKASDTTSSHGGGHQSCKSQEGEPPDLHDRDHGHVRRSQEQCGAVENQGIASCLHDHRGSRQRLCGFRPVCSQDLCRAHDRGAQLCEVGDGTAHHRRDQSKAEEVGKMDPRPAELAQASDGRLQEEPAHSVSQLIQQSGIFGDESSTERQDPEQGHVRDQRVHSGPPQKGTTWREHFERMGEDVGESRGALGAITQHVEECGLGEVVAHKTIDPARAKFLSAMADRVVPDHFQSLVAHDRPFLFEVACSPDSILTEQMQKKMGSENAAKRFAHWNGYDLTKTHGVRGVIRKIDEESPLHVWISTECGPFSRMQNLNQRTPEQREALRQKREDCMRQYVGGLAIYTHCCQQGIPCTWEWSETCDAWRLPMVQKVFQKWNPYMIVVKGCRVNLRDVKSRRLLGKGWKLATTHELLATKMHLPCTCTNPREHELCQGKLTRESAFYTDEFARRVCRAIVEGVSWKHLSLELTGGKSRPQEYSSSQPQCTCQDLRHPKSELHCNVCEMRKDSQDPFCMAGEEVAEQEPLTEEEKKRAMAKIAAIHRNTGHGPLEHMINALQVRKTDKRIVELARTYKCAVCAENKRQVPRPRATLEPLPPKWQSVQADTAHWVHPNTKQRIQFGIIVDEGCRFRVGKIMCKNKGDSVKGKDLIEMYQQLWKPVFGVPDRIRLDPAGPWRSDEVSKYFSDLHVGLDTIPAEAHWMNSHAERCIGSAKAVMSKLVAEFPQLSCEEALSEAIRICNEREIVRGYSPAQHALGRSSDMSGRLHISSMHDVPQVLCENSDGEFHRNLERMKVAEQAFTEWVYDERIKRALNSRTYKDEVFSPGDMVFVWRVQGNTRGPANSARTGGFTGPARILALETRLTESGEYHPSSVIWVVRGNRLLKTSPQQLRRASAREQCIEELRNPPNLPWTFTRLLEDVGPRQYEDVTEEVPDPQEWEQAVDEETIRPNKRLRGKQWVPDHPLNPENPGGPSSSSGIRRDGEESRRDADMNPEDEDLEVSDWIFANWSSEFLDDYAQCFWSSEQPAVEISINMPDSKRGKQYMSHDFQSFMVSQLRKRNVEVSEKHMTSEELSQMKDAKTSEVKKFLGAEALEALPIHLQPDRSTAMRMRWVLTWKRDDSGNKSAKARCVILGYLDPLYAHRQTTAPTMSRTTRQLMMAISASLQFKMMKGDVSGAFLQGREYKGTAYVIPTDEICEGMNIPSGSVTKLRKACYGLVDAPLEWFLTVSDYLTSIGFTRCVSDPCCFKYVHEGKLIGLISGHVDDFLFSGSQYCSIWTSLCEKIKGRFKWGAWEEKEFTQCGVFVRQMPDFSFELSQAQYIEDLKEIGIPAERRREPDSLTTDREKSKLRMALGGLSWCAQQTQPQISAAVSVLLSEVTRSTVRTMIEVNKVVYQVRANKHHVMKVHGGLDPQEILVAGWADAAGQNRVDGKSTQGMLVGVTSRSLLEGEMCSVSPISWHSTKIIRQCRSPGAAESLAAIDCEDLLYAVRLQLFEMLGNNVNVRRTGEQVAQVPAVLVTDSTNVYDRLHSEVYVPKGPERRVALEMIGLKQAIEETKLIMRWVHSEAQLANSLTKQTEPLQLTRFFQLGQRWKIVADSLKRSTKTRKKLGLETFENFEDNLGGGTDVISSNIHTPE